jgi:hypothetical protein
MAARASSALAILSLVLAVIALRHVWKEPMPARPAFAALPPRAGLYPQHNRPTAPAPIPQRVVRRYDVRILLDLSYTLPTTVRNGIFRMGPLPNAKNVPDRWLNNFPPLIMLLQDSCKSQDNTFSFWAGNLIVIAGEDDQHRITAILREFNAQLGRQNQRGAAGRIQESK